MKKRVYHALILPFAALFFLSGCTPPQKEKENTLNPYNYNKRNIYVFAVKATDSSGKLVYTDTLGLMCTNQLWEADSLQKWIAWLYLSKVGHHFILNPNKVNGSSTGIRSTENELFLHPPRNGQYSILETCAFPYILFPLYIGKKWDWDLEVGSHYSNKTIQWVGNETFHSHYAVSGTEGIRTPEGNFDCLHITATNTSRFGTSTADFYYSHENGLVKMQYAPLDKTTLVFELIQSIDDDALFKKMGRGEYNWFVAQ
jgi:hypothetical protein